MFEAKKTFSFEAGHQLKDHKGKCAFSHGHSYTVKVAVRSQALTEGGMVVDFQNISAIVKPMLEQFFDHCWLNDTLKMDNPTAEKMAEWIYNYLKSRLPGLHKITVFETATGAASYWED